MVQAPLTSPYRKVLSWPVSVDVRQEREEAGHGTDRASKGAWMRSMVREPLTMVEGSETRGQEAFYAYW